MMCIDASNYLHSDMSIQSTVLTLLILLCPLTAPLACHDWHRKDIENLQQCLLEARSGQAVAQWHLAEMYARGTGTQRNIDAAELWYLEAAEDGVAEAQYALAVIYENHPAQDYSAALSSFNALSQLSQSSVQANLGTTYQQCMEIAGQTNESIMWYQRAAEQGLVVAQFELGVIFDIGRKVAADSIMAYMWFDIAANNGHDDAIELRDDIARRMTPSQTVQAAELARAWRIEHP